MVKCAIHIKVDSIEFVYRTADGSRSDAAIAMFHPGKSLVSTEEQSDGFLRLVLWRFRAAWFRGVSGFAFAL